MSNAPWLHHVWKSLKRLQGSGVVVAVSGGGDSVGMLRVLHAIGPGWGLRLSVAHLDHGARGEEGRADARFVGDLAGALGLPVDLGQWRPTRAGHFEADARRARYAWLAGVASDRGARFVAVGHTVDDQAETILHRIVRGTGLRGLAGIPRSRRLAPGVTLIRPLLDASRRQVRDHLAAIGQGSREDPTNADTSRTRARIRGELLPELADRYNPAVADALVRLGRLAAGSGRALDRLARDRSRGVVLEAGPDRIVLDRPGLARLGPFERAEVLRLAWRRAGWPEGAMDARRWRALARWAASARPRLSVGAGVEATSTPDRIELSRFPVPPGPPDGTPVPLPVPGRVDWGGWRVSTTLDPDAPSDERVDLDRLDLPMVVRAARAGDRFGPLGMAGQTQPLNDFFRGRRVARPERGSVPLVCDGEGIVCVVGHRIAHRVRRTNATRRTLGLRVEPIPGVFRSTT